MAFSIGRMVPFMTASGRMTEGKARGRCIFCGGGNYTGGWKNNKKEGYGIYCWSNGTRYEGSFKNGEMDGTGTLYYNEGSRCVDEFNYEGEFKGGVRHGHGILHWPDGTFMTVSGRMTGGKARGRCIFCGGGNYTGGWKDNKKRRIWYLLLV